MLQNKKPKYSAYYMPLSYTGVAHEYNAIDSGDPAMPYLTQLKAHAPARASIRLKLGAQVLLALSANKMCIYIHRISIQHSIMW